MAVFGFFNKINGSDRYTLNQLVTSNYETESQDGDTLVREIKDFDLTAFDVFKFIDEANIELLSFGLDGSIQLRDDIELVEIVDGQTADPVNGKNFVNVTVEGRTHRMSSYNSAAQAFVAEYPAGYTAP